MTIPSHSTSPKIPLTSDTNSSWPCLAITITFLFFSSVGKSLSIRETSHRPWGSLSLSVICFKVLKSHNANVNIVNMIYSYSKDKIKNIIYQFSTFYNFIHQHQHSNLKCVHSKDTLTGDSSAVGQCGAAAGLLRLASNLRDPVL